MVGQPTSPPFSQEPLVLLHLRDLDELSSGTGTAQPGVSVWKGRSLPVTKVQTGKWGWGQTCGEMEGRQQGSQEPRSLTSNML